MCFSFQEINRHMMPVWYHNHALESILQSNGENMLELVQPNAILKCVFPSRNKSPCDASLVLQACTLEHFTT